MASLRSLLVLLTLLGLVCAATAVAQAPVEWYTEDAAGGGAVAGPAPRLSGGGAIAPINPREPATVNLPPPTDVTPSDSPPAQAARVPAAAPQDPQTPPAGHPAAQAAATPAKAVAAPAADPGPLPFTGLELALVAAAGLCLLAGGLALRPRAARR
jgi:hypothetical protein